MTAIRIVCLAAAMLMPLGAPAYATRIPWCMQVVPSGELVTRYGASWCKSQNSLVTGLTFQI